MPREYESEDRKVGEHIAEHRAALGISRGQLIDAMGAGSDQIITFVEKAQHPSILMIERHHKALMAAWKASPGHLPIPVARREQWYTTGRDVVMLHVAMHANPQISWWWGATRRTDATGAWCHYCSTLIHPYDVGRGITRPVRKTVMAHRMTHINDEAVLRAAEGGYAQ